MILECEREGACIYVEVGSCEDVTRVGTPLGVHEAGRALVDLALPLGVLERKDLYDVASIERAQHEVGVVGPLDEADRVQTRVHVDHLECGELSDYQAELAHGCLLSQKSTEEIVNNKRVCEKAAGKKPTK